MFEAFEVGPFIFWTGLLFLLIGIWLSAEFFLRLARSANLSLQHFRDHALVFALSFAIGGRIFAVLSEYKVYLKEPLRLFIFWDGGFSFLGGAIGIGVVLWWITRKHRTTFLQWLDVLVPAATLGMTFSWLGAFVSGEAYGKPTNLFFGVTYDAPNVRYAVPIHPVQLYYVLFYFALTFLLLVIRKRAARVGSETLVGILLAAVGTFLLEEFRGDFTIPVYATWLDLLTLFTLFLSMGVLAIIETRLSSRGMFTYEGFLVCLSFLYLALRPLLDLSTVELRFSQLLTLIALLGTVVYVVVHRQKFPHL